MQIASVVVSVIVCIISAIGQELHASDTCGQPESSDARTAGHAALIQLPPAKSTAPQQKQANLEELPPTNKKEVLNQDQHLNSKAPKLDLHPKPPIEDLHLRQEVLKQDLHTMQNSTPRLELGPSKYSLLELGLSEPTLHAQSLGETLSKIPYKSSQPTLVSEMHRIGADNNSRTEETARKPSHPKPALDLRQTGVYRRGATEEDAVRVEKHRSARVKKATVKKGRRETAQVQRHVKSIGKGASKVKKTKHSVETKDDSTMQSFFFALSVVAPILVLVCGSPAGTSALGEKGNQHLEGDSDEK